MSASFLTYQEWIEQNPDVLLEQKECEKCDGTGFVDCWHCGNEMECEDCDGRGHTNDARKRYEAQRLHDEKLAKRYAPKLLPAGFVK